MNKQCIKGVSLADTLIVVAITAMFAAIAFPSFTSSEKYHLDLATQEIGASIRFARSEAIRTGDVYGVDIDRIAKQFTVYKADLAAVPVGQEFIAYHPIKKNLYDYNLDSNFNLENIKLLNSTEPFLFSDSVRRKSLLFTATGVPVWIDSSTGAVHQLQSGIVQLSAGSQTVNLIIEPYTGRVIL